MKRIKLTNGNYKLEYDGYSIDVTSDDKTKTKFMLNIKEEQRDFVKNIFPEISERFKDKSFPNDNSIKNLINVSHSVAEQISGFIDNVNFIKIGTSEIGIERIHSMIKDSFSDINYDTLGTFESDEKMNNRHQINEDKKDGTVDIFMFEMEKHKLFKFISINNDDESSFELWGNVDNNDLNKIKTSLSLVNEELLNKTKTIEIFPENNTTLKISLSDISEEGGQYSKLNINIHNVLLLKDLEVKSFLTLDDLSEAVLRTDIINSGTEYSNKRDITDRYIQNFAEDFFLKSLNGNNFLEMGWTDIKLEGGTIDEFNSIGEVFGTLMDISSKVPLCHSLTMDCLYEDFKMEYSEANTLEINEIGNNITLTSNYTDTTKEKDFSGISQILGECNSEKIIADICENFESFKGYSCKVNGLDVTKEKIDKPEMDIK